MRTLFTDHPTRTARIIYLALILAAAIALTVQFIFLQQEGDRITTAQHRQSAAIAATRTVALEATRALCLRKDELRAEIKAGKSYLKQHPLGSSAIPLALIVKSIKDSEKVLATLRDVRCRSG